MSRQIPFGERELTEDEVQYLKDRGWGHQIALNDQMLAERRAAEESEKDDEESIDLDKLKVDELRELAQERGIEIPDGSKKADIIGLLMNHQEQQG